MLDTATLVDTLAWAGTTATRVLGPVAFALGVAASEIWLASSLSAGAETETDLQCAYGRILVPRREWPDSTMPRRLTALSWSHGSSRAHRTRTDAHCAVARLHRKQHPCTCIIENSTRAARAADAGGGRIRASHRYARWASMCCCRHMRSKRACESSFWADFSPRSSCRSPQAALKLSYRSDRVTR